MRFVRRAAGCGLVLTVLLCTSIVPVAAQDIPFIPGIVLDSYPLPEATPDAVAQPFRAADVAAAPTRPKSLLPLYGTLVILQGLDMHSTMRGAGAASGREANPVMKPFVNNGAAFLAVKTSATLGVIWMSEKVWRKHRKAAVVSVFVVNTLMAGVVANNYRINR